MPCFDAGPLPPLEERHHDPQRYPEGVAWLDGQYLPVSQAKVSPGLAGESVGARLGLPAFGC